MIWSQEKLCTRICTGSNAGLGLSEHVIPTCNFIFKFMCYACNENHK